MTITVDWAAKLVESDASITDLPTFHSALRVLEASISDGGIYDVIHTWKDLNLGGGAHFYQVDFINGYQLKFPTAGNYEIDGNLNCTIVPVAGVYVERKTSAAFITSVPAGASGITVVGDGVTVNIPNPFVQSPYWRADT